MELHGTFSGGTLLLVYHLMLYVDPVYTHACNKWSLEMRITVVLRKMQRFSDFATFRLIKRRHKFKKCSCICSWCDFCKINDECSLWQHWIQTSKQKQKPSRQPRQSCPHFQPIFCKIWNANFLKKFTYFQGFLLTFNVMTDIFWWFRTHISTISNCCWRTLVTPQTFVCNWAFIQKILHFT